MAGVYQRIDTRGDDETSTSNLEPSLSANTNGIPNSPPPSFHSRTSSIAPREIRRPVNPNLEDAFDDDDNSDDDADDRQLLVRSNTSELRRGQETTSRSTPATISSTATSAVAAAAASAAASRAGNRAVSGRVYGGGIQSDGVFSNLAAKPERGGVEKEELPPTYEQAAADQAPPYWETTILAPGLGGSDEVYIDGLPVGSLFSFLWNGMISSSFQLVGFLLTYLLHTTHAAKNGSRAGLGITLIQYGFYMKDTPTSAPSGSHGYVNPPNPNSHDFNPNDVNNSKGDENNSDYDINGTEWVAWILMVVGWFVLIRAVSDYIRARKHEQLILQSPDRAMGGPVTAGESPDRVV